MNTKYPPGHGASEPLDLKESLIDDPLRRCAGKEPAPSKQFLRIRSSVLALGSVTFVRRRSSPIAIEQVKGWDRYEAWEAAMDDRRLPG